MGNERAIRRVRERVASRGGQRTGDYADAGEVGKGVGNGQAGELMSWLRRCSDLATAWAASGPV